MAFELGRTRSFIAIPLFGNHLLYMSQLITISLHLITYMCKIIHQILSIQLGELLAKDISPKWIFKFRSPAMIPDGGVSKLPKNLAICDMLDVMEEHEDIMCATHPHHNAILICTTCLEGLCLQCMKVLCQPFNA